MKLKDYSTIGLHLAHCNQGENIGSCKYSSDIEDCPAFTPGMEAPMKLTEQLAKAKKRLELTMSLIERAASFFESCAPDTSWFEEYFSLTGDHMILTEEGWEPASAKREYLKDDPNWEPIKEVNAQLRSEGK
jgi:hypothetical protein